MGEGVKIRSKFGQNLVQFGQNLVKIWSKFGQNLTMDKTADKRQGVSYIFYGWSLKSELFILKEKEIQAKNKKSFISRGR